MTRVHDSVAPATSAASRPRHTLARKVAMLAFTSSFLTSLAVTWTSLDTAQKSLRRIYDRQVPASLQRVADRQVRWLQSGERVLAALAAHLGDAPPRRDSEALQSPASSQGELHRAIGVALDGLVVTSSHFEALALVTGEGDTLAVTGVFDRAVFDRAVASPGDPGLLTSSTETSQRLFAVTPFGASSPVESTLVGQFRPLELARALSEESPVLGASVAVFDPGGSFAVTSRAGDGPGHADPAAFAHFAEGGIGQLREFTDERGRHIIGCSLPFGLFGWQIAVEAPFDVAFEPLLSSATRMLGIELCIVLLFSVVAYRITTVVVRPIEVLSDGVGLIAEGVIDHEIPETGADDETGVLTRTFNLMMRKLRNDKREIEAAHRELLDRNTELQRANEVLNQLSITDGLTKLHNHRFFQDHLTREIKRVNRLHEPLAMILIDVDDFKGLNDRYGHATGDEVLVRIARIMEESVREVDLLARYGGEEFAVVASNTDLLGAYRVAEKIRTTIAETSFELGEALPATRLTVSVGVAAYEGNRKKFFLNADRALYSAKAQGKNCVVTYEADPV